MKYSTMQQSTELYTQDRLTWNYIAIIPEQNLNIF
jgi:hypothetical protein